MAAITNFGTINYSVDGNAATLSSNTVATDLNVTYSADMQKTASPSEFTPGNEITYQLRIENTGTGTLYNVSVSDDLGTSASSDKPLSYTDGSVSAFLYNSSNTLVTALTPTAAADSATGNIVFTIPGTIPEGYYVILTYKAAADSTLAPTVTSITNSAALSANEGGTTGTALTAAADATITREAVTIVKTASAASVTPGDSLVYTFTLTNIGTDEVTISSLTDQLPANFTAADTITASIGGTAVTYTKDTDYTVSDTNNLVISPAAASTALTIPAASGNTAGITTISISGTITA